MQNGCKQLPAVMHNNNDSRSFNVNLNQPDCGSLEAVAVNVYLPFIVLSHMANDEEVKDKLDELGVSREALSAATETSLDFFKLLMESYNE